MGVAGVLEKFGQSPETPTLPFLPKFFTGFVRSNHVNESAKFEVRIALRTAEIIGGTQKIWPVPGYALAPFSPKFFMGVCSDGPCECTSCTKFEVSSFTHC